MALPFDLNVPKMFYNPKMYTKTVLGSIVSEHALLCGFQPVSLRDNCIVQYKTIIRSDLEKITLGKYCIMSRYMVLQPSFYIFIFNYDTDLRYEPLEIGNYVFVGKKSFISAVSIGSCVYIGENVLIRENCVIGDCCIIDDNSVIPPATVIPPYSRYAGSPATCVGDLAVDTKAKIKHFIKKYYHNFQPARTHAEKQLIEY